LRKVAIYIGIIILAFVLVGCDLGGIKFVFEDETTENTIITSTSDYLDYSSSNDISSVNSLDTQSTTETIYTSEVYTTTAKNVTTSFETTATTATTNLTSSDNSTTTTELNTPIIPTGYSLIQDELSTVGIPANGDVDVLVFIVDFPDELISDHTKALNDAEIAFNGLSNDLEYESLNSYYLKSSYNQLNINADIFGVYTASKNSSAYETDNDNFYATDPVSGEYLYPDSPHPDSDIIYEVLSHYDSIINYQDYDSNGDNYIDGIYIIYNHEISFTSGSDLWWAYQYYYYYEDNFDGIMPNYYVWSGLDFFYENYETVNARTIIHETGHMLGLEDYYDYYPDDLINSGGLGTFMMDYTIGDHDAFSKILLGWITPIVIEESMTVDISKHVENGDVLLIIDNWENTIFDEYLLVSYYSPEGLNELDKNYIFTQPGIIIFHVSAAIDDGYNPDLYYYSIFNNNNTDTEDKLLKIVEADMGDDIEKYEVVEDSDLFLINDSLGDSVYSDYTWYTNIPIDLIITIENIDDNQATIEIVFE
jgi:M6 family metalloprotease-like protein